MSTFVCSCSSPDCLANGCAERRRRAAASQPPVPALRNAVIEECAKLCDAQEAAYHAEMTKTTSSVSEIERAMHMADVATWLAADIRKLKT